MRFRKRQRLVLLVVVMLLVSGATALVLASLQDSIAFFATPSELASRDVEPGRTFRIGGLVREGSVVREPDGTVRFAITDTVEQVPVVYKGMLPDLFREGQGVVALGKLREDGTFVATEVLAKHDERYMPREVSDALKEAGYWEETPAEDGK
ncbi:MAG TPA: cytochrome c maturation protein CcmE [Rhodospirillales bacterium]|nr:cytochrome c maturation protein CcmE [Rhodospirillales bacterium]